MSSNLIGELAKLETLVMNGGAIKRKSSKKHKTKKKASLRSSKKSRMSGGKRKNPVDRHFTIVSVNGKAIKQGEGGRYGITKLQGPSNAVKKAYTELYRKMKLKPTNSKLKIVIREVTRSGLRNDMKGVQKERIYGPYSVQKVKLPKPVTIKVAKGKRGWTKTHKTVVKKLKSSAKGGGYMEKRQSKKASLASRRSSSKKHSSKGGARRPRRRTGCCRPAPTASRS